MFDTKMQGIPCYAEVTELVAPVFYHEAIIKADPGDSYPEDSEAGYYDVRLYDRQGYRAKWLERKMEGKDRDKIVAEFHGERNPQSWESMASNLKADLCAALGGA
jgi:hypothetical protein